MRHDRRMRLVLNVFQLRLLTRLLFYGVVYQVTLWNFLFVWESFHHGEGNWLAQYREFSVRHYPMLFCMLGLAPFLALDMLRFSHRTAGPIYRLRQTFRAITQGPSVRPIKLRDGDYLTDVVDDFNGMVRSLQQRGSLPTADPSAAASTTQPA